MSVETLFLLKWLMITFVSLMIYDPSFQFLLHEYGQAIMLVAKILGFFAIGFLIILWSKENIVTPVAGALIYTVILFIAKSNHIIETLTGSFVMILLSAITVILTNLLIVYFGAYLANKIQST